MSAKFTGGPLLDLIRRAAELREASDQELLRRCQAGGDHAAFESVLRRHGPMVLGVCRSVLGNDADAEDAFQATFLAFATKAGSIRDSASLGSWLHGVAYRTALKARMRSASRREHEARAPDRSCAQPDDLSLQEAQQILHEELNALPDRLRAPLVLCYLEGATQDAAAARLGLGKTTLRQRCELGRGLLRARLTRRGLGPAALLTATAWPAPAVPAELMRTTIDAASLAEGVLPTMSTTKTKLALFLLLALGAGGGLAAFGHLAPQAAEEPKRETDAQWASRLGRAVHADAAAIGKLPRFSYLARYRTDVVDSLRAVDPTLDKFREALTGQVIEKENKFGWYEKGLSWDEKRLVHLMRTDSLAQTRFGTSTDAWERSDAKQGQPMPFTRRAGVADLWDTPSNAFGSTMTHFEFCYLRLTPHRHWWGASLVRTSHTMSFLPLDKVAWSYLGKEEFGGEPCDVVESALADTGAKGQRFWVSQKTGRVRGVVSYFAPSDPNELACFDDYREISPGVWLPFREVRVFPHISDTVRGKKKLLRSRLVVVEARAGGDLSATYSRLLPKEGDTVQDIRFAALVTYKYAAGRKDDEVRERADAAFKEQLRGDEEVKRMIRPLAAMVGKPAPTLPEAAWLGGKRPDVAGKSYLLHFWAAWCAPCKSDMPQLKALAESGVTVVGMHPHGTPAEDAEKVIRDQKLGYPTLLAAKSDKVGGYPVSVFPYCVVVDGRGRVAAHGTLADVMPALRREMPAGGKK